jgi:beta-N-acetylhexosaminidase
MSVTGRRMSVTLCALALVVACRPGDSEPNPVEEASPSIVQAGLDRVATGAGADLRGKRLGLVVHAASVTADLRHAIDVFQEQGLDVVRLFSPEHGLRSRAAAGEQVEDGLDPVSGLPVVSLYGAKMKPSTEELADLDALVFDLQGAGVRFYTYSSSMIECLEAAAEAGIEFVVLDRPNPLGGERVEGPVSAPREVVPESFVNMAPGPLVHGLTLGEMARYVNPTLERPATLSVIEMAGWRREMTWEDTGRPWVGPSPNLRTAEATLAYPGTALLESTNASEGRGTTDPFLIIGAPWIEPETLEIDVPGYELTPTRFVTEASPAAPYPKFEGEESSGWRVSVVDPSGAEPYRLGVSLLRALMELPDFSWNRDGAGLTWLVGTNRLLEDLQAGRSVDEIVAADADDHAAWRDTRRPALLY